MKGSCRACGNKDLRTILDLGSTPLANRLISPDRLDEAEPKFPLLLAFCLGCSLVQITETVPPETMFSEYLYFSSFSDTMLRHSEELAGRQAEARRLGPGSLVVEVASNDGYLLQFYRRRGIPVLGIEPAANVARAAEERGIPTLSEFFGTDLARRLREKGKRADVLHANNVLAHVPDLNGFVRGIGLILKDDGVALIEAPYLKDMLDRVEFDTIYHEHLSYFSLTVLDRIFGRHGLLIEDVERIPIHGGSLRVFAVPAEGRTRTERARRLLEEEAAWGVDRFDAYRGFGERVGRLRQALLDLLRDLKKQGKSIAVYGASAKGSTLLNCFGLDRETLDFVVDRSTVKQGRYTPGTRLLILAPDVLLERRPDYTLLLTWNFADEILEQQAEYRRRGGRFIIPIPDLRVV